MKSLYKIAISLLACALVLPELALAGPHHHPQIHVDSAYGHNHPYPVRGLPVARPPMGAHSTQFNGQRYWFHGGVWYGGYPGGYRVVGAPYGLFVPWLPVYTTVVMLGGMQYYYANETYYLYHSDINQYEVVAPPSVAAATSSSEVARPESDNIYVYPKNGQSAEIQARDRYECHRWAADQTGFDPTRGEPNQSRRADYLRAQQACLEGRGYTVK
jgi:hypothetical protein